jgi:hypothetical protein
MTSSTGASTSSNPAGSVRLRLIRHALQLQGFTEGPPPWASAQTLEIDRDIAARMRCPLCHRRGLEPHFFHRKPRVYKLVMTCTTPGCPHTEEA